MKNGCVWIVTDKTSSLLRVNIPGGKKVDITQYNIRNIPDGVVQGGIIYDSSTIADILKSQLQKIVGDKDLGEMHIVIPGDRVKTSYLYLEDFKPGELTHADVQRIEESFSAPLTKLRIFPETETQNGYIFHGVRHDIISPYISVLESLQITPVSILPAPVCLREALSKVVTEPSIILFSKNGLQVFAATPNSTPIHRVWSIDEVSKKNLAKAVKSAMKEAEEIIGVGFERVLVVETGELSGEQVEEMLEGMNLKLAYFQPKGTDYIEPIDLLVAKGSLTKGLIENECGFALNPIDYYDLKVKSKEANLIKATADGEQKKDYKVAILSTILAALMLVTGLSLLWEFYLKDQAGREPEVQVEGINQDEVAQETEEQVQGESTVVMELPEEVIEEEEEEEVEQYTREDVKVVVLNGNGRAGEAKSVARLLQDEGFRIERTDNADSYDYEKTTILAPSDIQNVATEAKQIVSAEYPLAFVEISDGVEPLTIFVVLGAQ